MRPKSDARSRAASIKALRSSSALALAALEDQRIQAQLARAKAADMLAHADKPSGWLGRVAMDAFSMCAEALIVNDGWSDRAAQDLAIAMEFADAIARWHEAIGTPKSDSEGYTADSYSTLLAHSVWTTFLLASLGDWTRAKRMATYLLGYLRARAFRVPDSELEADYVTLFGVLLNAIADDAWPTVMPESLGPYHRLIHSRGDPEQCAAALVAVADLRMARGCGYAQVDDARGLPPSAPSILMADFTFSVIPAELWAIRELTQRLDGYTLCLDAEHPWLRAGFAQFPDRALPEVGDELLVAVQQRASDAN